MILQTCWNYQSCKENQQNPELNARSGKRHCPKNTISLPPPEIARSNSMSNSEPRTCEKRSLPPHCLTAEQPASSSTKSTRNVKASTPSNFQFQSQSTMWTELRTKQVRSPTSWSSSSVTRVMRSKQSSQSPKLEQTTSFSVSRG